MNVNTGWFERDMLDTFYLIVEGYLSGKIGEVEFHDKIFKLAERYGRHSGKEELNRNQMNLFTT